MATNQAEESLVQTATRVPASLLETVTAWCAEHEVGVEAFIEDALRERLRRAAIRPV